jgi:hypothetical protein
LNEGKLFYVYDYRHATFENVPFERRFVIKAEPNEVSEIQKKDIDYAVLPRYWVDKKAVLDLYRKKSVPPDAVFLMRNASQPMTNARVSIGTLAPFCAASNGCPLVIIRSHENHNRIQKMILFAAVFNSLTFDFILRQKMATGNINKFILYQVAAPHPSAFKQKIKFEDEECTAKDIAIQQVVALQFNTNSMQEFFEPIGYNLPMEWDLERRMQSFCIVDALVAHLYGLSREQYAYILSRFRILAKQEEKVLGEFKTRELCLHYFDQIKLIQQQSEKRSGAINSVELKT